MAVFLFPTSVSAASLYFASPKTEFAAGEEFTVAVLIDAVDGNEPINAVEGKIVFPPNFWKPKKFSPAIPWWIFG